MRYLQCPYCNHLVPVRVADFALIPSLLGPHILCMRCGSFSAPSRPSLIVGALFGAIALLAPFFLSSAFGLLVPTGLPFFGMVAIGILAFHFVSRIVTSRFAVLVK